MCRFLIDNGADVDFVEPDFPGDGHSLLSCDYNPETSVANRVRFVQSLPVSIVTEYYVGAFISKYLNPVEADKEYQKADDLCCLHLLEANLDPFTKFAGGIGGAEYFLSEGTAVRGHSDTQ